MKALGANASIVALGEVMLRFDPGPGRVNTARRFDVWEGGGEYNVARSMRRAFGQRAAIVTALVENPIGALVEDLILQGGVETKFIHWRAHDGVGRECRNGLNFTDRGFGPRAGSGCYDRGHTAVSQLAPGDIPWQTVFGEQAPACFHTGGIFAALGERTADVALEGMQAAKAKGALVAFDLNYRASLWLQREGERGPGSVLPRLVHECDVLFGNAEQFVTCLGAPASSGSADAVAQRSVEWVQRAYPNVKGVFCTTRYASDASQNRWGAIATWNGEVVTVPEQAVAVYDRVGGGDSAAAAFLYGLLTERGLSWAARAAVTHGALTMSTPGDNSMVTLEDIELAMNSEQVRMVR